MKLRKYYDKMNHINFVNLNLALQAKENIGNCWFSFWWEIVGWKVIVGCIELDTVLWIFLNRLLFPSRKECRLWNFRT